MGTATDKRRLKVAFNEEARWISIEPFKSCESLALIIREKFNINNEIELWDGNAKIDLDDTIFDSSLTENTLITVKVKRVRRDSQLLDTFRRQPIDARNFEPLTNPDHEKLYETKKTVKEFLDSDPTRMRDVTEQRRRSWTMTNPVQQTTQGHILSEPPTNRLVITPDLPRLQNNASSHQIQSTAGRKTLHLTSIKHPSCDKDETPEREQMRSNIKEK
ncbi:unnamed protein product [Didymodactylos carnosus]|uniref:Uncharacterized protein n=1 Tax=Didymodactylos carnosus TaxID=1234261 RepID=A0A814BC20_9BILA|nr:unnamed protein product [Didymodactylos carnosus]CAF0978398.1 unnamed protein product [Didymodactylos carnosus]CAF3705586.1 unnamed protein product [Didymodactylos carnosus]CAF3749019.1 unnamed protein product [Didymodactylos carnosus]